MFVHTHHERRCRPSRRAGATLGLLLTATLASAQTDPPELGLIEAGARVGVRPFANVSGQVDTDWIGRGIAEAVGADLSGRVSVTFLERPSEAGSAQGTTRAVDCPAGLGWLVHGGFQQLSDRLRVTIHLVDCVAGSVAASARVDGRLDDLFSLQDRLVPALAEATRQSAPTAPTRADTSPPTGVVTPPSAASGGGLSIVVGAPPAPVAPATVSRNAAGQATVRGVRISEGLDLDGVLDEPAYMAVEPISDFIQLEPNVGEPASERTEVWLLFDDENFYVSARLWHSLPESEWIVNEMRRDSFNLLRNEGFGFLLDTFYDRRNGILFRVNPLGGRMDAQISNERDFNGDWNPIWDVRTGRFDGGWTFEAAIPFKSMRYRPGEQVWSVQLSRNLQARNEQSYLTLLDQGVSNAAIFQVSGAATLVGVEVPATASRLFEVKPYVIGDVNTVATGAREVTDLAGDYGLDVVKVGVTENLTADFTVNTDFAQVEADTQQVNLTRFSLFFPEKREFFLENQGVFGFGGAAARGPFGGSAETPIMFYSRQIGLNRGREVPITAGGRLTGRVGRFTMGLLNIQTGEETTDGKLNTNFTVARLRRDVLRRSAIGAMLTNRSALASGPGENLAMGVDGTFAFYDNVLFNTYWARTRTTGVEGKDTSYKGEFRYDGDKYGVSAEHLFIDERFSPGVGFIRRPDLKKSFGSARYSPRPASIDWIRQVSFDASFGYFTDAGGVLETRETEAGASVSLENSDSFDVSFTRTYDVLQNPFRIASDVTIPVGAYDFHNTDVSYRFGPQRKLSGSVSAEHGTFYGGTKTAVSIGGGFQGGRIEISPQFALEPGISINRVELPQGNFTTQLITTRTTYTFSPTMFVSALIQYNSSNSALSSNVRLRWEYQPGSELFVVFNEQRDTLTPNRYPELENRAFIVKFNRLFRF